MSKFIFRLEKLLEFRKMQEKWAKDAYLEARAKRFEGEQEIADLQTHRFRMIRSRATTIEGLRSMESYLTRLDDEERAAESAVAVLEAEEHRARDHWFAARAEAEGLQKLRDQDESDWRREEDRREQDALDEWAVMRRAA